MDINKHGIGYEHKHKHDDKCQQNTTNQPDSQFPLPTISSLSHISLSPRPSQDSQDLVRGIGSYVHPPTPEMDGSDGYRRRRALLASEKHQAAKSRRKKEANMHDQGAEPEDGDSSDFSSHSTGDDIELHYIKKENGLTDDEETGLDREDMKRRSRKKRKNTLLDQRVIGSKDTSIQDRNLADRSVLNALLINTLLIASWYFFSLSISIYNKWMFSEDHLDFHFPLFTTCMHMLVQFSLASTVLYFVPRFRPHPNSISDLHDHVHARSQNRDPKKPLMTRMFYATRIGPCGAATGLDIGLGNTSVKYITLTFFTMCKSSSLAFVLLFAFLFHLETPSLKLILIIATMTAGIIMMVAGETAFNALGFILVISSAFFSGFRWALTQILLLRNPATSNPFSSIFFLAPIMFITLAIIAIPVEGFVPLGKGLQVLTTEKGTFLGIGILLFPGVLAFLMTASEFALLKRTSVVTLSICGIFKEVVTISAAGIVFHDPLTPINVSGLIVTIGSIAAYNYTKIMKMREDARAEVAKTPITDGEASLPMLPISGNQEEGEEDIQEDFERRDLSVSGTPVNKEHE